MSKNETYDPAVEACVALQALKGEHTVSELAVAYKVNQTTIYQ